MKKRLYYISILDVSGPMFPEFSVKFHELIDPEHLHITVGSILFRSDHCLAYLLSELSKTSTYVPFVLVEIKSKLDIVMMMPGDVITKVSGYIKATFDIKPKKTLEEQLEEALDNEEYELATKIRDEINATKQNARRDQGL